MSFQVSEHYARVRQFMERAGQATRNTPQVPPRSELELRARLIMEEALETVRALGFTPRMSVYGSTVSIESISFEPNSAPDLVGIADGCADVSVVTVGTLISCGIPDVELLRLVDESNLAKFGPGSYRREDGKWCKGPHWTPPDIKGLLNTLANSRSARERDWDEGDE